MANYRVPVLEKFTWQEPVADIVSEPVGGETKGARYLVSATPTALGDFDGQANKVAWFDGTDWLFDTPTEGWRLFVKDVDSFYWHNGTGWTDELVVGDLTINGDIETTTEADWDLIDNKATALSFDTAGMTGHMLNFDTRDGAEVLSTDATLATNGVLDINNNVDMESQATDVYLKEDETQAVSFDTTSLVGILAINTTIGAETVNVGRNLVVAGNLTVNGTTTTIDTEQTTLKDPLITLNRGGAATSAAGVGLEFEEDALITGYIKTSADRNALDIKVPGNAGILSLDINATETISVSGSLDIEADSKINQDVTTDSVPQFAGLNLDGDVDLTTAAVDFDLITNNASALSFDSADKAGMLNFVTTTGFEKLTSSVGLDLGANLAWTAGGSIASSATEMTLTNGSSNSVTVTEAEKAYDSRAKWDSTLGVIVFDAAMLDAA